MWVYNVLYSDLFTYEDIKRTHEDNKLINKTPIHEIMGQNTNDLIAYICVPNKRNKKWMQTECDTDNESHSCHFHIQ